MFAAVVAALATIGCDAGVDAPGGGAKCSFDTPCASGEVCQDGSCRAPCLATNDCSDGQCDTASGLCVECLSTSDCGGDRVCNELTGKCVQSAPGCTGDGDCAGLICDLGKGACVQCQRDEDCGLGARCNLLSETCALQTTCVNDGDCGAQLCNPDGHTCVDCYLDAHCPGGVCDLATNSCPTGCVDDDATEPNNGDGAVVLANGGEHEGHICPDDIDEFSVQAEGDLVATVNVEGGALLALRLLDANGDLVSTAVADGNGGLRLQANALASGFYLLSLGGALHDSEGDYLLHVDITAPNVCAEIDTEPNGTTGTALPVPTDGTLRSGSICAGANATDLWSFTAAAGDDIDVAIIAGEGAGVLDGTLANAAGTTLATGTTLAADNVTAGTYTVRVTASADVTYSVRVTATSAPPVCMQRDAEPNDLDAQALPLTTGVVVNGTVCAGDVNQHRFAATALDDAHIVITGVGMTARLVRSVDGAIIGTGTNITAANLDAGGYRVVINGTTSSIEGDYTVRVDITPEPVPDPCLENGVEPDDSAPRLLALDGTPLPGRICASDTDFFTFTLTFNSTITVTSRFTHAQGDLDMRLVDSAGTTIRSSVGVTDNEVITEPLTPGTYGVRIFGFSGALNTYTMEATLVGCSPEDGFEENNTIAHPTPLGATTVDAVRCPGDDDFFAVRLESGDALNVSLAPTGGPLTMSLVSTAGALLVNDSAAGANRSLTTSGLPAGRYLVRVTGTGAARVTYALTTAITPTPSRCVDDGASPNETAATAFDLDDAGLADGSYDIGSLVTCDIGDPDWFAIDLPAGKLVTAQLAFPTADDVDVEVLEPRGTSAFTRSLARSFATDTQDRVSGVINQSGRYFVRAIGFTTGATPYSLGIEVGPPPSATCLDDRFDTWTATENGGTTIDEQNDTALDAIPLSPPESLRTMRACPNDGDWHKVTLSQGNTITVHLAYAHSTGHDIDMRLYGPANQTAPLTTCTTASNVTGTALTCSSAGVDGTEDLVTAATTAGDHFIEVFGFNGGDGDYDLDVTVQ